MSSEQTPLRFKDYFQSAQLALSARAIKDHAEIPTNEYLLERLIDEYIQDRSLRIAYAMITPFMPKDLDSKRKAALILHMGIIGEVDRILDDREKTPAHYIYVKELEDDLVTLPAHKNIPHVNIGNALEIEKSLVDDALRRDIDGFLDTALNTQINVWGEPGQYSFIDALGHRIGTRRKHFETMMAIAGIDEEHSKQLVAAMMVVQFNDDFIDVMSDIDIKAMNLFVGLANDKAEIARLTSQKGKRVSQRRIRALTPNTTHVYVRSMQAIAENIPQPARQILMYGLTRRLR